MDLEKLQRDLNNSYNTNLDSVDDRVEDIIKHIIDEWKVSTDELSLAELKAISTCILSIETNKLKNEVETLLAQKEQIERQLDRKSEELQESKYTIFNALETELTTKDGIALSNLHQVKLESLDLFDILGEMVESAIITALEKDQDGDIRDTTEEIIKDLTYEAVNEGSLNTIRLRQILSTILNSAVDIAEATPNRADEILEAVLRGMRSGLVRSIDRFKRRLVYMPTEAKHILIEDYDTIIADLNQTDVMFTQVIETKANESNESTKKLLIEINKNMRYDLEELVHISKETAEIMKDRFSAMAKTAVKRADEALKSQTAKEAKRMGKQAWRVAKTALGSAIKSAKDAIDTKDK